MIMAIAVIVIMATIMALSLSMTSVTSKRTVDLYIYEQAVLLSKSATEYALLRIAQDGPCSHINDLNFNQDSIYDINITNRYVYTAPFPAAGCTVANTITVQTPEQSGSVIMDVTVSVNNTNVSTEPIRFFKRTIQKL
jgi:hypothetical protein